jgi:hypothetical protein
MNIPLRGTSLLLVSILLAGSANAQGIKMGEVIVMSTSAVKKDVKGESFKAFIDEVATTKLKKANPDVSLQLFQADRGNKKGEFLLALSAKTAADREAYSSGSPFTDQILAASSKRSSDFLDNTHVYTEYRLIGANKFTSLPVVDILGIHYIKVKKERSAEFEKFVIEKLHPAVGQVLPDMHLLYYKATAGDQAGGTYITIFAITSVAARDKYWPAGAPETKVLKDAFGPHQGLAKELGNYLVEGSYLEPSSGGAAAYFESKQWTDFIDM